VSRPPASIRISLKERGGLTYRIELIRIPFTRRFRIRRNGSKLKKLPEGTATEVAEEIRRWLATQASKPTTAEDVMGRSLTSDDLLPVQLDPGGDGLSAVSGTDTASTLSVIDRGSPCNI